MNTVIKMEDVSFSYDEVPIVRKVSLQVTAGEFLGIIGPNAGGKTTLLKLMLGLLQPDQGQITLLEHQPHVGCLRIAYVPQHVNFSRDFPINVLDTVLMGRMRHQRLYTRYDEDDRAMVQQAISALSIESISKKNIGTLSGGQLQRVLIARALAANPEILIMDEPTANIDMCSQSDIFSLLKQYNEQMTIVVVSHDIGFISAYIDRVACMNQTLAVHPTAALDGEDLKMLYGIPVKMIQHQAH